MKEHTHLSYTKLYILGYYYYDTGLRYLYIINFFQQNILLLELLMYYAILFANRFSKLNLYTDQSINLYIHEIRITVSRKDEFYEFTSRMERFCICQ